MPRLYHSPSSIELAKRCPRAWAYQYLAGMREPSLTWAEIEAGAEHTSRQRSTALGVAMHAALETWYCHEAVDWQSVPGQVALSGAHLLPHPDRVHEARVEEAIGDVPLPAWPCDVCGKPPAAHPHDDAECALTAGASADCSCGPPWHPYTSSKPPRVMLVDGVPWAGFRDLLVRPHESELKRLAVRGPWLLVDYKSSANVERYALTPAELAANVQANLYAIDVCRVLGTRDIDARWVYFETKRVRRARAVDARLELSRAEDVIGACNTLAREVDRYTRIEDAPCNPAACGDYGGCSYHKSAGGPCDARRSVGGLIQARVKKDDLNMALSPDVKAKFEAKKQALAGGSAEPADESEAPAPAPAPAPAKRGPKPKAAPAPAAPANDLVALATELAQCEARALEIKAAMREALA